MVFYWGGGWRSKSIRSLVLRGALPSCPFLIPGFGAQGADASMALCGLKYSSEQKIYQGGIVSSSRDITFSNNASDSKTIAEYVSSLIQNIERSKRELKSK